MLEFFQSFPHDGNDDNDDDNDDNGDDDEDDNADDGDDDSGFPNAPAPPPLFCLRAFPLAGRFWLSKRSCSSCSSAAFLPQGVSPA